MSTETENWEAAPNATDFSATDLFHAKGDEHIGGKDDRGPQCTGQAARRKRATQWNPNRQRSPVIKEPGQIMDGFRH
jgi:hypothetical protein